MGFDLLDLQFRIEKSFKIKLYRKEFQEFLDRAGRETTIGDLHSFVQDVCVRQGIAVPASSWNRLRICMVKATGCTVKTLQPTAKLVNFI